MSEINLDDDNIVNLDVTTIITLISEITHDPKSDKINVNNDSARSRYIKNQMKDEQKNPVYPKLLDLLEDKILVATQHAIDKVNELIDNYGTDGEKERKNEILKKIHTISNNPSELFVELGKKSKIWSDLNVDIFGTSDQYGIYTVTGNLSIGNYLRDHDYLPNFDYTIHRPRCFVGDRYYKQ